MAAPGWRRHVDDVTGFLFLQKRQRGVAQNIGRAIVDRHHQVEAFNGQLPDRLPQNGPGIVDDDIDAAKAIDRVLHKIADILFGAHVGFDGQSFRTLCQLRGWHRSRWRPFHLVTCFSLFLKKETKSTDQGQPKFEPQLSDIGNNRLFYGNHYEKRERPCNFY